MTQEEKARAYDEALERARNVHRNYKNLFPEDSYSEDIEDIFPQLRESEDERIRKEIVGVIQKHYPNTPESYRWISWLEKQKEPKQTDLPAGFYYIDLDGNKYYSKEFRYGDMKVKVGEQKPNIEICPHSIKSKSYKENGYPIENCDYGLEIALAILETTLGEVQGYQTDDGLREHQTAIKAVKDAMKEQKPVEYGDDIVEDAEEYTSKVDCGEYGVEVTEAYIAGALRERSKKPVEWNDADMKEARENLITCCRDWEKGESTTLLPIVAKRARHFLENTKPAEWSEEDEKMIDDLIRFFNEKLVILGEAKNAENTVQYISYKKVISWLKSLRPHWKPSEEHLSALLAIFNDPNNIGSQTCQLALTDLYEQLKKL